MKPIEIAKAIVYPVTESAVLIPLVVFWLLMSLAQWGGIVGLFLLIITLLAVFRYQMILLEARAQGRTPATPDIEFFNWFGSWWALFPLPVAFATIWAMVAAGEQFGGGGILGVLFLASAFWPAFLVALAITHSPLQSLNPIVLARLLARCGETFWFATVYLLVTAWLSSYLASSSVFINNLVQLFLSFSFFSLTGSLVKPYGLIDDVYIPDALEPGDDATNADIEKARSNVLGHAYGFMSRGNREGGLKHVMESINGDPDPVSAWAWFFDGITRWEDPQHMLYFARHYIHDMLQHGENLQALKLIMRCRLVDENFRPDRSDLLAAIEAAESNGDIELAAVLKRY